MAGPVPVALRERRTRNEELLHELLTNAVAKHRHAAFLFSGGLDTSVLACAARALDFRPLLGITICVGEKAPDLDFSSQLARALHMEHRTSRRSYDDLALGMPELVRILKTYDPMELRNSVVIYTALLEAKAMGIKEVMTGDGADELFAGYSFFAAKPPAELKASLVRLWEIMHFSAPVIGESLGIDVRTPYLEGSIRRLASRLSPRELVTRRNGQVFGKAILRRAFKGGLPEGHLWRRKDPVEIGSGSTGLPRFFEGKITDFEWRRKRSEHQRSDGVTLRSKEHLAYYEIYRRLFGPPRPAGPGERPCPDCRSLVAPPASDFCRICGAWPVP